MRTAVRFQRAVPPAGQTVRAGLCVGVPAALGIAWGEVAIGVTLALACVLRTVGERDGPHRTNARSVLIATPIAACGYLFGLAQGLPLVALVALMAAVAFLAGTLSVHGAAFALGGMQFLLISSIALGVPDAGTAAEIGWFLAGAAVYGTAMAVDLLLIEPRRADRLLLDDVDRAVRAVHHDPGPEVRARANVALAAARRAPTPGWQHSARGVARWGAFDDVVQAADDVVAWEGARGKPDLVRETAYEAARRAWAEGRPSARPVEARPTVEARPWSERLAVDPATRAHAARLALCFGLAVSSRAWIGLDHWFWVPATVGLVMQPDFGSVFGRAVLRVVGTIAGSALAALVLWGVPDGVGLGLAIGVIAAAIPWAMRTSYILHSLTLAAVVLLLVFQVVAPGTGTSLPAQRVLATSAGGIIVLVFGYLIWPAARRVAIAPTITAATRSIASMLRRASEPVPTGEAARDQRRAASIAARHDALDLLAGTRLPLARAAGEPPPASTDAAAWSEAVRSIEALGAAVSDHAIARSSGAPPLPDAGEVADQIDRLGVDGDPLTARISAEALTERLRAG